MSETVAKVLKGISSSRQLLTVIIVLFLTAPSLYPKEYYIEKWGCFLDLPQGLNPLEVTDVKATFCDDSEKMFFQIRIYPAHQYSKATEIFNDTAAKLNAEGDALPFNYRGYDSVFADITFPVGSTPARGYSLFMNGKDQDLVILSFCDLDVYDRSHFFLLSALDSFSPDIKALYEPGPVSTFYETSFGGASPVSIEVDIEGEKIFMETDSHRIEAAEIAAEREASVLSVFKASDTDAWSRFYRMIYRDNYSSLKALFNQIKNSAVPSEAAHPETASRLLSWLQGFDYSRSGTLADFSPPLTALRNQSGDCDSLALLYIILLRYYGIESILMVSDTYSHSMAAVDVPGEGARFPVKNKKYLVAEMTENVSIGQINAAMADPAKWLGIDFSQ